MPGQPTVLVVDPLIVGRVIKRHRPVGFQVPHGHAYVIPAAELRHIVEPGEVGGEWGEGFVGLVADDEDPAVVARRRFHTELHLSVRATLSRASDKELHARVGRLGSAEFDAVRAVLLEEALLVPPYTTSSVWEEFVVVFLELRHCDPQALATFFPTLTDLEAAEALVSEDVDPDVLASAPQGGARASSLSAPSVAPAWARGPREEAKFAARAAAANERKNHVRAAILLVRARLDPDAALLALGRRLFACVEQGPEPGDWVETLRPLLAPAGSGYSPVESRILMDLQRLCEGYEHEILDFDPVGWVSQLFRTQLVRRLPGQQLMSGVRRLRSARKRLARARVDPVSASRLAVVFDEMERALAGKVRGHFEPLLSEVLMAELPAATNLPEEVAQRTLVGQLVDRLLQRGFLTIGDLRDAMSRSPRKLPDLSLRDMVFGDGLLRADRGMSRVLDGAYRRGEIYMRALLRVSALFFGTKVGRVVTRFGVLPFGGAYVILAGLEHLVNPVMSWAGGEHVPILTLASILGLGAYLLALLQVTAVRAASRWALGALGKALGAVVWVGPRRLYNSALVQAAVNSAAGRFAGRYLVKPGLPAALFAPVSWALGGDALTVSVVGAGTFLAANVLLNSRFGRRLEDRVLLYLAERFRFWWHHLLPGLLELVLGWFRLGLDGIERVLYRVDEFLRFRTGDAGWVVVLKALFGVLWGVLTYVVRIYVNLLIEPQVNPIKHFPVVTVSHKIILPFTVQLTNLLSLPLRPALGPVIANTIVGPTVVLIPGVFGFLVWEFKANWLLFAANRPRTIAPVVIGHHGESMLRLMKPGFHSGTLPRLYRKLRAALAKNNPRRVRTARAALRDVRHSVETFLRREFVALAESMGVHGVAVSHVVLGSNRIQATLRMAGSAASMRLDFEEHDGWLLARLAEPGWIEELTADQRAAVEVALEGVYAMCGVDLLASDIDALVPDDATWRVSKEGLTVFPTGSWEVEVVYDLRGPRILKPRLVRGTLDLGPLDARTLMIGRRPLALRDWADRATHLTPNPTL